VGEAVNQELFFRVPAWIVTLGLLRRMTLSDMTVCLCLSSHMGWRSGKCWPGWKLIAQETNLKKDAVFRALRNLKSYGVIQISKRGRKNEYILIKSLRELPVNIPVGRERSRKSMKRDKNGRIVPVHRDHIIPVQRERTIPVQPNLHSNEKYERKEIITRKSDDGLVISKKTLRENLKIMGPEKLMEYMIAHGHDPARLQELIEEEGETHG
jgi:hypothetical protein